MNPLVALVAVEAALRLEERMIDEALLALAAEEARVVPVLVSVADALLRDKEENRLFARFVIYARAFAAR